jgi:hypothetical protein
MGFMTDRTANLPEGEVPVRPAPGAAAGGSPSHILAASSPADERTRVLKHGDTFAVFDHYGDVKPGGLGEEGLYHEGTRYLSCLLLEMKAAGRSSSARPSATRRTNWPSPSPTPTCSATGGCASRSARSTFR